jgi:hypothetical protein
MAEHTIGISDASYQILRQLAERTGEPITTVLHKAVDDYRRKLFLEELNAGYAALRADPTAWAEIEEERRSMDGCLMDGLDPKECWGDDGDLPRGEGESLLPAAKPKRRQGDDGDSLSPGEGTSNG